MAFEGDLKQKLAKLELMITSKADMHEIIEFIDEITKQFPGMKVDGLKASIDDPFHLRVFEQEKTINTLFNNKIYMKEEVERITLDNREFIVQTFAPELHERINEITFSYKQVGSETHHLGKSPVFISLAIEGVVQKQVVYKPRDAKIDKKVVETLERINNLPLEHRSGPELVTVKFSHLSTAGKKGYLLPQMTCGGFHERSPRTVCCRKQLAAAS